MIMRPFALSIVVPVYRGATSIGRLVDALAQLQIAGGHEVILVNDGSPDDSGAICRKLAARADLPVTFVDLSRNFGEHNAVLTGLRHARGDFVITMDDDLQNPISEVARLFEHARAGGWDVVYTYYATKQHAAWRNLGSRFANLVADALLDKPRGLYLSSFRCMSAFAVDQVIRYEGPFPYIDGLLMQATQHIDRIQVEHLPREHGESNYTIRRLVRLWLNLFVNFSAMPLRIASVSGMALTFIGLLAAVAVSIEALFGNTPPGWASLMAATLLLSGVQLMLLGVLGEYLGRLYLTVNGKPQAIVREVVRSPATLRSADLAVGVPAVPSNMAPIVATGVQNAAQRWQAGVSGRAPAVRAGAVVETPSTTATATASITDVAPTTASRSGRP
jgi:glycosyltransferase involved in cell wall biosynthesis